MDAPAIYGLPTIMMRSDYLGGLSLAVEGRTVTRPEAFILQHATPGQAEVQS